jgi:general stress protein YciG
MTMTRADRGRLGGLVTSMNHDHEFYKAIGEKGGKLGGRPRRLTLQEIRALQSAPEAKNI